MEFVNFNYESLVLQGLRNNKRTPPYPQIFEYQTGLEKGRVVEDVPLGGTPVEAVSMDGWPLKICTDDQGESRPVCQTSSIFYVSL